MSTKPEPTLTQWQSTQASMLYFFTSLEYLQVLQRLVTGFLNGVVDPLLDADRYGDRNPLLTDPEGRRRAKAVKVAQHAGWVVGRLQTALTDTLAKRQSGLYPIVSVDEYLHHIGDYSLAWARREEEEIFLGAIARITRIGSWLDDTLSRETLSRWDDFNMIHNRALYLAVHPHIGTYRVRLDVCAETGMVPPVTGVYVALDDQNATLQFAHTESGGRTLRPANTFNEIGLAALDFVGRDDLWLDHQKMFAFAASEKYAAQFHDELRINERLEPTLASSAVARAAFKDVALKWYLVEPVGKE